MIGRFSDGEDVFYGEVIGDHVLRGNKEYSLSDVQILPPVTPSKIICIGINYRDHADEMGLHLLKVPIIFLKPPSSIIGHDGSIIHPLICKQLDYEGELAVIINKRCKNVREEEWSDIVGGYTCFNDVTARDLQKKDGQWTRAKSFDTFSPIGPWIAPNLDSDDISIKTRLNGKIRQNSNTLNLIFDIPSLIHFISSIMTLEVGDVIDRYALKEVG